MEAGDPASEARSRTSSDAADGVPGRLRRETRGTVEAGAGREPEPAPRAGLRCLVVALYPPGSAPSSRFRCEQFFAPLAERGVEMRLAPFFSEAGYAARRRGAFLGIAGALLAGAARRLRLLFGGPRADVVLVHREAAPVWSTVLEWALKRLHKVPVVYDFDDAIWLQQPGHGPVKHRLRSGAKLDRLVRLADVVIAGNAYLADHARALAADVRVIPTVVDTEARFATLHEHREGPVTIGWTGSASSVTYLRSLAPVLRDVAAIRDVRFLFISDQFARLGLEHVEEVPWSEATEVSALARVDIGLMPLSDDAWTRGKCGFKIIQYMALGIVPVASPVGANRAIVTDGVDGILCEGPEAWRAALVGLIDDPTRRAEIGARARQTAVARYSLASQLPALEAALRDAAGVSAGSRAGPR